MTFGKQDITAVFRKNSALIGLLYALVVLLVWHRRDLTLGAHFDGTVGFATFSNYNIAARVSLFYNCVFLFFGLCLVLLPALLLVSAEGLAARILRAANHAGLYALALLVLQLLFLDDSYRFLIFWLPAAAIALLTGVPARKRWLQGALMIALLAAVSVALKVPVKHWVPAVPLFIGIGWLTGAKEVFVPFIERLTTRRTLLLLAGMAMLAFIGVYAAISTADDFFVILKSVITERRLGGALTIKILMLAAVMALSLSAGFFFIARRLRAVQLQWAVFILFFIVLQFSKLYLPSLVLSLGFALLLLWGARRYEGYKGFTTFLYTTCMDLANAIGLLYLVKDLAGLHHMSYALYLLPVLFLVWSMARALLVPADKLAGYYRKTAVLAFMPLILLLTKEAFMVSNSHAWYWGKAGYFGCLILLSLITGLWINTRRQLSLGGIVNVYFIALISGLSVLNAYTPILTTETDLFESASQANAVRRLVTTGQIPLLENFSPHNFDDYLTGLVYSIFNKVQSMEYRIYFFLYGLYYVLYYCFLRRLCGSRVLAFLVIIFHTFIWKIMPWYHGIVLLGILALYHTMFRRSSVMSLVWSGGLYLFILLFRPDIGVSFTVALVTVLGLYLLRQRKELLRAIGRMHYLVYLPVLTLVAMLLAVKLRHIPVQDNFRLILSYLKSYQSYGSVLLTPVTNYKFIFQFFVFPACVLFILAACVLRFFKPTAGRKDAFALISIIFLCVYYLSNYQRGIVRHTFCGMRDETLSSHVFLILSAFVAYQVFRSRSIARKFAIFVTLSGVFTLAFKFPSIGEVCNMYTSTVNNIDGMQPMPFTAAKIDRAPLDRQFYGREYLTTDSLLRTGVISGAVDELCYKPLTGFFLHTPYIHFFNQGFHCYHNETLQGAYNQELETAGCNYVLVNNVSADTLPNHLDLVPHAVRQPIIMRYIYSHYHPAVIADNKTLWVKNGRTLDAGLATVYTHNGNTAHVDDVHTSCNPALRYLITVSGGNALLQDSLAINNNLKLPAAAIDVYNHRAYFFIEHQAIAINSIALKRPADSLSVQSCSLLPDIYTAIPRTYNLELYPYVLGKDTATIYTSDTTLYQSSAPGDTIRIPAIPDTKGTVMAFEITQVGEAPGNVGCSYYAGSQLLGIYLFKTSKGNHTYYLNPAYQYNWNAGGANRWEITAGRQCTITRIRTARGNRYH